MKQIYVSIVIPAYNEETNIRLGALDKVARYLSTVTYSWEVVLVNDGSSDASAELMESFCKENRGFKLINNQHVGKAGTVIKGVNESKGTYVLFTDLDQATPLNQIEKVLPKFEKGADIVIGSRSFNRKGAPLLRRIMASGFMVLRGYILGLHGIVDTQCGFKAFKREVIRMIVPKLHVYAKRGRVTGSRVTAGFDIELLFVAKYFGYSIVEVPVEWHYVETRRVNPVRDSIEALIDMVRIRINALKGTYR